MERLLFITLGTNKYATLAKECIESFNNNLTFDRNKYKVDYLLLTDRHQLAVWQHIPDNVMVRYTQHLPWPLVTLTRWHIFLTYRELLEEYHYVYFINSDLRPEPGLNIEELLPQQGYDLVGVSHPGFDHLSNDNKTVGTFEINKKSIAHIDGWTDGGVTTIIDGLTNRYIIGAFQGGMVEPFIDMCEILKDWTDKDLSNNIIPIWHDESLKNAYAQKCREFQVLPPTYCQPQNWPSLGKTRILKLEKNHAQIRS